MTVRTYRPADASPLLELFRDTIRRVNSRDYSPEQIAAWASEEIDPAAWAKRFDNRFTVVAEDADVLLGFTDLEMNGHIDRFFVSADHQGRGIGRQLMAALIQEAKRLALPRLFVEASITARPFFETHQFQVLHSQVVVCRGVEFTNFCMERWLTGSKR